MVGDVFPVDIGKVFIKDIATEHGFFLLKEEIYKNFHESKGLPFKIFQNNQEIDLKSEETKNSFELLIYLDILFNIPTFLVITTHSNYKFFIYVDDISDISDQYNTCTSSYSFSFYYNKDSKEYSNNSTDLSSTQSIEDFFNKMTYSSLYNYGEEYRKILVEKIIYEFEVYKNKYEI
jgi:hypothetical protein